MGKECDPLRKTKARYANKKARLEADKEELVPELNCLQENILVPELNCLQENIVGGGSLSSSSSNKNANGKSTNSHNLKATFFGVVCTKCGTKVNERGNPLLPPSQTVMKNHWLVNKCINGYPDSEKARKSLEADLKNIRLNAYQDL
jgi:hypothetical protein